MTTPLSAQSLSGFETLGWALGYALLPALFSRVVPISAEGWAAYMFINMTGNITGHANIELIPNVLAAYRKIHLFDVAVPCARGGPR